MLCGDIKIHILLKQHDTHCDNNDFPDIDMRLGMLLCKLGLLSRQLGLLCFNSQRRSGLKRSVDLEYKDDTADTRQTRKSRYTSSSRALIFCRSRSLRRKFMTRERLPERAIASIEQLISSRNLHQRVECSGDSRITRRRGKGIRCEALDALQHRRRDHGGIRYSVHNYIEDLLRSVRDVARVGLGVLGALKADNVCGQHDDERESDTHLPFSHLRRPGSGWSAHTFNPGNHRTLWVPGSIRDWAIV